MKRIINIVAVVMVLAAFEYLFRPAIGDQIYGAIAFVAAWYVIIQIVLVVTDFLGLTEEIRDWFRNNW